MDNRTTLTERALCELDVNIIICALLWGVNICAWLGALRAL